MQLSSIVEMLESAFYGLDLLKLHSVTTKLVGRVEKLEEVSPASFSVPALSGTGLQQVPPAFGALRAASPGEKCSLTG